MSSAWSWYIIIGTILGMVSCFWLIVWTNKQRQSDEDIAESESHVWDENIRELNNPLPMWWLWLFVLTLIFSGIYLADGIFANLLPFHGRFSIIDAWLTMAATERIIGFPDQSPYWFDLGTSEKIRLAEEYFSTRKNNCNN